LPYGVAGSAVCSDGSEVHVKMCHELRRILSQTRSWTVSVQPNPGWYSPPFPFLSIIIIHLPYLLLLILSHVVLIFSAPIQDCPSSSIPVCTNILREPSRDTFRRLLQTLTRPNPPSISQFCHSEIFLVIRLLEDLPTYSISSS
jgi:hypothetical protein